MRGKAIVAGGAGFVGGAVAAELLSRGFEVAVVTRPDTAREKKDRMAALGAQVVECDLGEIGRLPALMAEGDFGLWYQFAWEGLFGQPLLDYATQISNIKYVMDAIAAAKEMGCRRFIGAGSISQYELEAAGDKADAGDKHRVYKAAKLACQHMGRSVAAQHGIEFFWPIITNIFGEGETSPRLVNTMVRNLLAGRPQPLSQGRQIYDFIHVADAARAFADIGERGLEGRRYVIGSGGAKPLKDFLTELRDVVSPGAELGFGQMAFNGIYLPADSYDISQLREDTGFQPELSFAQGVRRVAEWLRQASPQA